MIASVCRLPRYRAQHAVTRLDTDDGCVLDLDYLASGNLGCTDFRDLDCIEDDGCVDDPGCVVGLDDLGADDLGRIALFSGERRGYFGGRVTGGGP